MPDIPTQNLFNTLMQIYQGTANTAGSYGNLAGFLEPFYGALGLGNYGGSLFGYQGGAPALPGGTAPAGGAPVGPTTGPATPAGTPGSPVIGAPPAGATNATGSPLYSPPEGTLIGLGKDRPFMDPYAGMTPPSQAGFQPGIGQLNTMALNQFGPGLAGGLLQANPYLSDALNFSTLANLDASQPLQSSDILNQLNSIAGDKLDPATFGQLSAQESRDLSQGARTGLGPGGIIHGNTGDVADLLGRDRYVQQRQQAAEALGAMVQGLNTTQQGQELSRIGMAGNLANQTAANTSASLTSPILELLGFGNANIATPNAAVATGAGIFNPFQQLGSDVLGFNANAGANSAIMGANADAASQAGWLNLAGSFLGALSDERLKKRIKKAGKSPSGIPEIEWQYKTDTKGRRFHGASAQDVEKVAPFAVLEDPLSGVKTVDYSAIDVPFYEVNPYVKMRKAA